MAPPLIIRLSYRRCLSDLYALFDYGLTKHLTRYLATLLDVLYFNSSIVKPHPPNTEGLEGECVALFVFNEKCFYLF